MHWRIETWTKASFKDTHGDDTAAAIRQLGMDSLSGVQAIRLFLLDGELDRDAADRIARELLADPVTEDYHLGPTPPPVGLARVNTFEVFLKPGVTDPVAASAKMAIEDMGLSVESVRSARRYFMLGTLTGKQKQLIAQKVLANDCIEEVRIDSDDDPPSPHLEPYQLDVVTVPIRELDDEALVELSRSRDLFLNLAEMKAIQAYYSRLDREPRDVELEMLAQTWSEHCVHKTFRGTIEMTDYDADGRPTGTATINNLLKSTIARATRELSHDWCISVFEDNAGVVDFDETDAVCFKVETHNHPSAIEPYGGAATGIGGCIRDPMGTGLGAKPIANTDIFCFAPPDKSLDELPAGVLHPRRVMKGVVSGVRDYGNRMGIPTVNGAIHFDDRYLGNPLVFCGNIGIMPRDMCFGQPRRGDLIVVVGGRTGRDGIHGATFSSGEMTHEHETLFSHAVQIGNAITEKKVLDTLLQARDAHLYNAITDCGAGGLSSAVGEMGETLGATVDLDKVPLKYAGLSYTEIWISEAQERMVISVPPANIESLLAIFEAENVEATVIGSFPGDGRLHLRYQDQLVGELDMAFLHDGIPRYTRKAEWKPPRTTEPQLPEQPNYTDTLKALLGDFTIASKEWVIRQYDHEVQGGSALKPLVGIDNDGPGDAAVVRPKLTSEKGLAIGCGLCPQYSDLDPYAMALAAVDEAVRNVVAVGGRTDRIAILDNFCWGNCNKADRLGALVQAARGCYDAAMAFRTPFISGKDSLNNEFQTDDGTTINIPGTLLISAMTHVDDVGRVVSMDIKRPGSKLVILGETRNELGGSAYYRLHGQLGATVPRVDLKAAPAIMRALERAIAEGLILASHDCSEGGIAVALAEMAFAGGVGVSAQLSGIPCSDDVIRSDQLLFSETPSRLIVEVAPEHLAQLADICRDIRFGEIGVVTDSSRVVVTDAHAGTVVDAEIAELKQAWQQPLKW